MMKMEIVLDDEKLYADGGHELFVKMYTYVDNVATGYKLTLQPIENNRLVYNANDRADDCSYIGLTYLELKKAEAFMKYCKEWLWIEIDSEGKTIVNNILRRIEQKDGNMPITREESSYKQITFELDPEKMRKHFHKNDIGYLKLKDTLIEEGFENIQGADNIQGTIYQSKEKMDNIQLADVIYAVKTKQPWLGECCSKFDIANVTKDDYDYMSVFKAAVEKANKKK